ncbi:MAG: nucleoside deaminase [Muribaculaceae bacterium]|nr:nucleoside deaminase [Muribaculaceae bacterium]
MRTPEQQTVDLRMMALALRQANEALEAGEIPVGAVIALGDKVIATGRNMTEALNDVTAHAEMIAITAAANALGGKYLPQCTLYVTVEPCIMCAGALGWSQIGRIVYGAADDRRGYRAFGVLKSPLHPRTKVEHGLLAAEATELMRRFFASKR